MLGAVCVQPDELNTILNITSGERAQVVIVGFQAEGTTGRKIVDGAKQVKIFRENVVVRAKVFTIGGFSAHADQNGLLEWASHFESSPRVFVVHGEATSSEALAKKIHERLNLIAHIPRWKEQLVFKKKEMTLEEPPVVEPLYDVKTVMLNTIIDLENELKVLKKQIKSKEMEGKLGEDDRNRLEYIKEEIQTVLSK